MKMQNFIVPATCYLLLTTLITGCKKPPTSVELSAPQNLTITVIQEGTGIKLQWDEVSGANGYYIYFGTHPDSLFAICKVVDQTYFIHESAELDAKGTGYYGVLAVGGEYDSVVGPLSNTVRTAPYKIEGVILYERNYNGGTQSAFGWDTSWTGRVLSINDTSNRWHFYLDDGDSTGFDSTYFKFVTPGDSVALGDSVNINHPPPVPWDNTQIILSSAPYAPLDITGGFAPLKGGIKEENTFYLLIDDEYYAKLFVQSVSAEFVKFDAYFQALKGFRRF